jgi:hypothetical protein
VRAIEGDQTYDGQQEFFAVAARLERERSALPLRVRFGKIELSLAGSQWPIRRFCGVFDELQLNTNNHSSQPSGVGEPASAV